MLVYFIKQVLNKCSGNLYLLNTIESVLFQFIVYLCVYWK